MVVVAQLVRALVCGTRGGGFETHLPPKKQNASMVELVVTSCLSRDIFKV